MPTLKPVALSRKRCIPPRLWLGITLLFLGINAYGQKPTEFELKAVFLYNFVNFVEWPDSAFEQPSTPFVIGVAGFNVFGSVLDQVVAGETYRGRPIEVRYIMEPDQALKCHMVYLERTCPCFEQVLNVTDNKPILTVSDTEDFMQKAGMIRFYLDKNQLRMEINPRIANDRGLVISSKLLSLANIYTK